MQALPEGVARADIVQCYADALRVVWIVMTALSAFALCISVLVQHFDLDRELETEQGFIYNTGEDKESGSRAKS